MNNSLGSERLLLIDASIYIFKSYFSLPDNWRSQDGLSTHAVYGYTLFLLKLLESQRPAHIAAAYDESLESGFRHRLSSDYKANRVLPDEALAFQLDACQQVGKLLGLPSFASEEYEADDLIGSLATIGRRHQRRIDIISRDKDLAQLLSGDDRMWDVGAAEPRSVGDFEARFGIRLQQLPDYLALVGDSIDNICGVPGVGPKTAALLLQAFGSIESLLEEIDSVPQLPIRGAKNLAAKIAPFAEQLRLNLQLTTIRCDVPLIKELSELRLGQIDLNGFAQFCQQMGLGSRLIDRAEKVSKSL